MEIFKSAIGYQILGLSVNRKCDGATNSAVGRGYIPFATLVGTCRESVPVPRRVLPAKSIAKPTNNAHIAQGFMCLDCHSTADTDASATLPSIYRGMLCHEKIATNGPGAAILLRYAEQRRELPRVRTCGFAESTYVRFRHAPHVRRGISYRSCHGDVQQMTTAQLVVRHSMGTCLTCHRQNRASGDCVVCHY